MRTVTTDGHSRTQMMGVYLSPSMVAILSDGSNSLDLDQEIRIEQALDHDQGAGR
jgi:hypothetical protein